MNVELSKKALEKVGNPHVLVNLISRRVRQLSNGGGGFSRPLVDTPPSYGLADIALLEIIEEKIGFDLLAAGAQHVLDPEPPVRRKKRAAAAAPVDA
ncbi:MAG TPA: DNA-directed RNA polymerase subunit omega [Candidatus Limnocylindria bacterium]|nr:DNA-directed RNA polymerase subunit omega [Candidatus Limnocylindria bacterium]